MRGFLSLAVLAFGLTGVASGNIQGAVVYDFENGLDPFTAGSVSSGSSVTGPGAIATNHAIGTNSYYLGGRKAVRLAIPASFVGTDFVVRMSIFDQGLYVNPAVSGAPSRNQGPRWGVAYANGVANTTNTLAVELYQNGSSILSSAGYNTNYLNSEARFSEWFSPNNGFTGRQVVSLGNGGSNPGTGYVLPTPGVGKWTEWTFTMSSSSNTVTASWPASGTTRSKNIGGFADEIWLYGGQGNSSSSAALAGVWVDNITITALPEPGSMALLMAAALPLWRRRVPRPAGPRKRERAGERDRTIFVD